MAPVCHPDNGHRNAVSFPLTSLSSSSSPSSLSTRPAHPHPHYRPPRTMLAAESHLRPSAEALLLLSAIPPAFCAPVRAARRLVPGVCRRVVQIRGSYLLILRPSSHPPGHHPHPHGHDDAKAKKGHHQPATISATTAPAPAPMARTTLDATVALNAPDVLLVMSLPLRSVPRKQLGTHSELKSLPRTTCTEPLSTMPQKPSPSTPGSLLPSHTHFHSEFPSLHSVCHDASTFHFDDSSLTHGYTRLTFSSAVDYTTFLSHLPFSSTPTFTSTSTSIPVASAPPSCHTISEDALLSLPLLGTGMSGHVRLLPSGHAVKLVTRGGALDNPDFLRHILHERMALHTLTARATPYTVRLHAAFQTPAFFGLVIDAVGYGDLHEILMQAQAKEDETGERVDVMPVSVARHLFAQCVVALHGVHKAGMLYRDMQLSNVLVTGKGHVRLCDFGLVKPLTHGMYDMMGMPTGHEIGKEHEAEVSVQQPVSGRRRRRRRNKSSSSSSSSPPKSKSTSPASSSYSSGSSTSLSSVEHVEGDDDSELPEEMFVSRAKSFVGTKRYMAPEVCVECRIRSYGAKADVWALGIILHVLLTGYYPFNGKGAREKAHRNDYGTFDPMVSDAKALFMDIHEKEVNLSSIHDAKARDLLSKMLRKDPAERADVAAIVEHPWMHGVDWTRMKNGSDEKGDAEVEHEETLQWIRATGMQMLFEDRCATAEKESGTKRKGRNVAKGQQSGSVNRSKSGGKSKSKAVTEDVIGFDYGQVVDALQLEDAIEDEDLVSYTQVV